VIRARNVPRQSKCDAIPAISAPVRRASAVKLCSNCAQNVPLRAFAERGFAGRRRRSRGEHKTLGLRTPWKFETAEEVWISGRRASVGGATAVQVGAAIRGRRALKRGVQPRAESVVD